MEQVVNLRTPLEYEGKTIEQVTVTHLKNKHLKAMPSGWFRGESQNPEVFFPIIASMMGVPPEVVDEMDVADTMDIIEAISGFLAQRSPKTGGT